MADLTVVRHWRWSSVNGVSRTSSVMPRIPPKGVRISWLTLARNASLARFAASAASLVATESRLAGCKRSHVRKDIDRSDDSTGLVVQGVDIHQNLDPTPSGLTMTSSRLRKSSRPGALGHRRLIVRSRSAIRPGKLSAPQSCWDRSPSRGDQPQISDARAL